MDPNELRKEHQLRTFEMARNDGKPPALRHIAAGGLMMQVTTVVAAGVLAGFTSQLFGKFLYHFTVWIAVGLTLCGASMYRRGIALRPSWDRADISASKLTNFQHLVAIVGGALVFSLRGKMLGGPTLAFFIIESAFLLVYVNFILLSLALKVPVDRSTWAALLLLAAACYTTFDHLT